MAHYFCSSEEAALSLRPEAPLYVYRKHALQRAARCFAERFPGETLYAVKTNPDPLVIRDLYEEGIRSFDVASATEMRLVRENAPGAKAYFMHPVKSRGAIKEAYFEYGVRDFSLDAHDELVKIRHVTGNATDLYLYVRIALPCRHAKLSLSDKFGAKSEEAVELLRSARETAKGLGVCFHVGSQCMRPEDYRAAIAAADELVKIAGVEIDVLDIGGGFPSVYPGMAPEPMEAYFDAAHDEFSRRFDPARVRLIAEPGRALVAESGSVIVRVDLRKGRSLYINDGTYGMLFDAGSLNFVYPARLFPGETRDVSGEALEPFSFFGPTCDSLDSMKGPFFLPSCVGEGDYIEIGQLGAYGRTMATAFNGFTPSPEVVYVEDEPLMTRYVPSS